MPRISAEPVTGNFGGLEASPLPAHGYFSSLNLTLPPLGLVALKR